MKKKSHRVEFLKDFLGALGARELRHLKESQDSVSGRVVYDTNDPEEVQDFCWHMNEEGVPGRTVFKLAMLLNTERLLDIDKISVSQRDLLARFNNGARTKMGKMDFHVALEELMNVRVGMVDDGKEGDFYFIHT